MKQLVSFAVIVFSLLISADSLAQNFTNKGKEFWVGYGHHQYMEDANNNSMNMVLYLSADQPATVTVRIENSGRAFPPLAAFTRTYNIPANTVIQTENLPKGSTDAAISMSDPNYDARLFDLPTPSGDGGEKLFTRNGIHITSNVPIVAYAHIYGGVASGATMLMPVDTWGYSYTSINSEQVDAAGPGFSWVYVVAKDSGTRVRITPAATSRKGKPAGVPFTVDMNKGDIYQLVGQADGGGNGPEFTGTTIKSIVGADGRCHPVGVFSGSSRTRGESLVCGTGSGRDNDIQQCFPEQAWGKRYLTAPFSTSSGGTLAPSVFQTSIYKVVVKDPATIVKRNGITLTGLIGGKYYKYSSNTADYIMSDKPVMIAQFMSGANPCNPGADGDPEMVYLSPIEQAIKAVGFFRNNKQVIYSNYLTLVVPTAGVASLRIDNSQLFSFTYPHPNLAGYTVVIKGWAASQSQSLVTCDSAFTAITYGLGSAESYGFNAGTYLKNLNAVSEIHNTPDTAAAAIHPFTCTGTPLEITALVAYKPSSMNWKVSALVPNISPAADVFVSNPVAIDSVSIGIAKYYKYKLPGGPYTFNQTGTFDLPIVCTSVDIDNCSLSETLQITVVVKARPSPDFTFNHTGCRTDSVSFFGPASTGTYTVAGWNWAFGDATTSAIKNPRKSYAATGTYNVKLTVTSTEGCIADTTKPITIQDARKASIFASAASGCVGTSITFNDTTTLTTGTFYWNFGTGTPITLTSNTPQTVTYNTAGTYIVKHAIQPPNSCLSDTVFYTITIADRPVKPIALSPVAYCQNATAAPLTATALTGNTLTWYNNFPLNGGSATAPTPVTTSAGTQFYYVTQTNSTGCISDTAKIQVDVTPVIAGNSIGADQTVCSGSPAATLTATGTVSGGTGTYTYQWQTSTNGGSTWTDFAGATAATYSPGTLSTGVTQFRRVVTSGLCNSISNTVSITVQTNLSNYEINTASTAICAGSPPPFMDGQTPTGGTGTYTYQWQSSADGSTWSNITGATAEDYQPPSITVKTYFRRITTGGNCPAISSAVIISVNPLPTGSIAGNAQICQTASGSVSATISSGTAPFSIQYTITNPAGVATPVTQSQATAGPVSYIAVPVNSAPGVYTITLQSISDATGCTRTANLNTISIEVIATPVITFNPSAPVICQKDSVTITASGGTSYIWSPANGLSTTTGAVVKASPLTTTTYTVIAATTGATVCSSGPATVTVTVNPLPAKPVAVTPVAYCQNATAVPLSATATAGNTLKWYSSFPLIGGSGTAPVPSTATAGTFTYYATQTNAGGCQSDTSVITVNITAAISGNAIMDNQTICSGTPVAPLTGSGTPAGGTGTYTYQWQSSTDGGATWTNVSGATTANYSPGIIPAGITKFRRVVASGLCNSISNVVSIDVQTNLNNYNITGAQVVCEGVTPAVIDGQTPSGGTGAYTYVWESSADNITWTTIAGATSEDYQPPVLATATYYRRTTSGGNCPAISNSVLVTVNPKPAGTLTGGGAICSYDSAQVTFTPSAGTAPFTIQVQVTAPGGGTLVVTKTIASNAPLTFTVVPVNSAGGTYTIALTSIADSKGCSRTTGFTPLTVTVTAKPVLTVTAATTICQGTSLPLTVSGATTYTWSPATGLSATTGSSISATPDVNTMYTVTGTTNGCVGTDSVKITVTPRPAKPGVTDTVTYCQGTTASALTATALSGNTLTWYTDAGLTGGSGTAPTPSTTTSGATTYYVTQTNSTGCQSLASPIVVVVSPVPVAVFTLPAGVCMPNGTALFTNTTAPTGNSALTYSWNFGDPSTGAANTSSLKDGSHVFSANSSYVVTLTATNAAGCSNTLAQNFNRFFDKPVADFDVAPLIICQGQNTIFTESSNANGGTINKWSWDFGDFQTSAQQMPTHKYTSPGTYTVKLAVSTTLGCTSDTLLKTVTVFLQPKIDAGPGYIVPAGTVVQLKATANDTTGVSLLWTPATALSNPTILRPTLTVTQNQVYTLTATGANNCKASDTVSVRVLQPLAIPNVFSPNGDGINDKWAIPNLSDYPGAKVEIFNRWGQQVFLSYGYNKPWDGTYLGNPLPLATYYYVITLNNGFKPIAGSITIIK